MPLTQQDRNAALALLVETFPQTFVLEQYRPHRPLKIGIAADLQARFPAIEQHELSAILRRYTSRVMYLKSMVAGAARVDLDGNPASAVTARDAEHAIASLAGILTARQVRQAAAKEAARAAKAAVLAEVIEARRAAREAGEAKREVQVAEPMAATVTPPIAKGPKQRPVLHLPGCK